MKAPFSLFLALRYLKPKRTFVSIITLISILGVTVGIMVLIIVIAVMTGFDQELRKKVLGFEPHMVVSSGGVMDNWRGLKKQIEAMRYSTNYLVVSNAMEAYTDYFGYEPHGWESSLQEALRQSPDWSVFYQADGVTIFKLTG